MIILICIFFILSFILNVKYYKSAKINHITIDKLSNDYKRLLSQKKSSEVRLGQISENLAPFLKNFKYDPKKTNFLGNPIDYIVFEEDKIIFLEIKSGKSKLSSKQIKIRNLIKNNKVVWDEMRID